MVTRIFPAMAMVLLMSGCGGFVPPGTKEMKNNTKTVYVDKKPLTNLAWKEYLHWLKNHEKSESNFKYEKAIPDSAAWKKAYPDSGFLAATYNDQPVVGITLNQAQAYAEWRSKVVSEKFDRQVTYRLADLETLQHVSYQKNADYSGHLQELTANGKVVRLGENVKAEAYTTGESNLGFRCVATYGE